MPKNVIKKVHILDAGDMSLTSVTSDSIDALYLDNVGLEVTWTGTPTGTITVEASITGTNFYSLTFSPTLAQPSGSASGYLINLNQFPFIYYRLKYTRSSGSGTIDVWATTKEI